MSREELFEKICPFENSLNCQDDEYNICCKDCWIELNKLFDKYDAKIRTDTINRVIEAIDEEYYDGGYGDYHEVAMIVRMLEQLKEGEND